MKIHKSKSGYYIRPYVFVNGVKKQTTYNFKTKEEALQKVLELSKGINTAKKSVNGDYSFEYVWLDYMSEQERQLKPTTFYTYRVNAEKHILKFFKNESINSITRIQINKFISYLTRLKVSMGHKNTILGILKSFFRFCVLNYDTNHSWVGKIPPFREDVQFNKSKSNYYTMDEFNQFISGTKTLVEKTLFTVLMFSGLRIGELRAMVWSDFNYKNKSLTINKTLSSKTFNNQNLFSPKTASSNRTVFIPDEVSEMLLKLKKETNNQNEHYIFSGDKSISETTIHRMNTRISAAARVKKIKIHEFRHSYATLMVKKGMTASVLQKQLGHSDIKVTLKYYVHFELEDQSNEVKSIFEGVKF